VLKFSFLKLFFIYCQGKSGSSIVRWKRCHFTHREKDGKYLLMDVSCAILAGGKSTRIGEDKATLEINGEPLIHRICTIARRIFNNVVIVSKQHSNINRIGVPVIYDTIPIQGSLAGIVSALLYSHTTYVFVLACDMPNVSEKALFSMVEEADGADIIVPHTESGYEPLHALYNRSCISPMLTLLSRHIFRISALFPYLVVKELQQKPYFFHNGLSIFMNVNTREDVACAQRLGLR